MASKLEQKNSVVNEDLVPTTWPGAFGLYQYSRRTVLVNWRVLLGLVLVSVLASIVLGLVSIPFKAAFDSGASKVIFNMFYEATSYFISFVIQVATILAIVYSFKNKKTSLDELKQDTPKYLLDMFVLGVISFGVILLSLLLFIVPFFFVAPRIALAQYYLVDKGMRPMEALKASWNNTRGNVGKVYGIFGVFILMILPTITIIGFLATVYLFFMYQAAYALLYAYMERQPKEA